MKTTNQQYCKTEKTGLDEKLDTMTLGILI